MRLIVFFDLPVQTAKQRKDYRLFRKFLLKDGYLQLQESVYASSLSTTALHPLLLRGFERIGLPPDWFK